MFCSLERWWFCLMSCFPTHGRNWKDMCVWIYSNLPCDWQHFSTNAYISRTIHVYMYVCVCHRCHSHIFVELLFLSETIMCQQCIQWMNMGYLQDSRILKEWSQTATSEKLNWKIIRHLGRRCYDFVEGMYTRWTNTAGKKKCPIEKIDGVPSSLNKCF